MRKKWEIEEKYRNFCRNNKELALQMLRELTLTPTETGKEDQRIAYCMEWMKQQGMESVPELIFPILSSGDAIGSVILCGKDRDSLPGDTEKKLLQVAATYLGREMEN